MDDTKAVIDALRKHFLEIKGQRKTTFVMQHKTAKMQLSVYRMIVKLS